MLSSVNQPLREVGYRETGKNRLFVDLVAGEPRYGCADAVQPLFGGIPEAGGPLPRFGLDIRRGASGRVDGADAVRGHVNFFLTELLMRIPIISREMPAGSAPDPASTNT